MKKTFIALIAAATLVAAFVATGPTSTAQPAIGTSILSPSKIVLANTWATNRIAGSSAFFTGTNSTAAIDVSQGKDVAVTLQGNLIAAGTTTFAAALSRSIAGSTNREVIGVLTATAAGTTPVIANTNITLNAFDRLHVEWITNANGTAGTYLSNVIVFYKVK